MEATFEIIRPFVYVEEIIFDAAESCLGIKFTTSRRKKNKLPIVKKDTYDEKEYDLFTEVDLYCQTDLFSQTEALISEYL